MNKLKDYIVEVAYSDPSFPLIENLAKIEECVYFDSTTGYLRDGIGRFIRISEEKLKKSLLEAKLRAYETATEKGRKNVEYLEKVGKKLFRIKEINKIIKSEEDLKNQKVWFLARLPKNFDDFSFKSEEWIKEIYLVKNSAPFNLYIRCDFENSLDFLSNELSRFCKEPLERELVIVFTTFQKFT
ncbi:MAG: hypothetical protein ACP5O8_00980 [Candidatus Aenigmatarchaeota archaeon]